MRWPCTCPTTALTSRSEERRVGKDCDWSSDVCSSDLSTPHTLITLVVGLLLPAIVAADVNVSGASFPERMTVDGHPLVLNGYGVRETWWINLYAVALYLPHHSADVKIGRASCRERL